MTMAAAETGAKAAVAAVVKVALVVAVAAIATIPGTVSTAYRIRPQKRWQMRWRRVWLKLAIVSRASNRDYIFKSAAVLPL